MRKIQLKKKFAREARVKAKVANRRMKIRATAKFEKLLSQLKEQLNTPTQLDTSLYEPEDDNDTTTGLIYE